MSLAPLDALEARRLALSARIDALPPEVVHQAPAPGAWSLAQIADHFVRIERTVRLEGKPATALTAATAGLTRNGLMTGLLALPLRLPMPPGAVSRIAPSPDARWAEVKAEWEALRAAWREALPALPPRTVVFKHPVIGLAARAGRAPVRARPPPPPRRADRAHARRRF